MRKAVVLKTTRVENSVLSILYHSYALIQRVDMTANEIAEHMTSFREMQMQAILWTLKTMADRDLIVRTERGWQISGRGKVHWDKLCETTRLPNLSDKDGMNKL
jgi:predicted transcriptional regulator